MIDTKECNSCHKEKPLSEFSRHAHSLDGRRRDCKECLGTQGDSRPRAERNAEMLYWRMQVDRLTTKHKRRLEAMV